MKKPGLKYKLLSLMNDMPNGKIGLDVIFHEYEARYKQEMQPSDFEINKSGNIRWRHSLQGKITECRTLGFLITPERGHWQITKEGRQWIQNYNSSSNQRKSLAIGTSPENKDIAENSITTNTEPANIAENNLLEAFGDFFVPLMRVLDRLPNRTGKSGEVLRLFEETYRDRISPHQYTKNQSGNIRWEHNVRWSREKLKLIGFIDAPRSGIWRLTDEGHLWLRLHPDARRLSVEKPKFQQKKTAEISTSGMEKVIYPGSVIEFLSSLQKNLQESLKPIFESIYLEFVQRSNYLQIRLAGFSGCHYEIILRRNKHEIALHFESSAERSKQRLQGFEPYLDQLSQSLKMPVLAGNFQTRGWTQVRIETQAQSLTQGVVRKYSDLVFRFVAATFPILQKIYGSERGVKQRRIEKGELYNTSNLHIILDKEVETIRAYLQGRSFHQLSDEKLCDWVNFCYTFEMYGEGRDLFSFISESEVNQWYYERTRKVAKACEQKAKLNEMSER